MPKLGFNPGEYQAPKVADSDRTYDTIKPGWYSAEILDVELKEYASGKGGGVCFTWSILGPSHEKRRVWDTQTTNHTSEMAEAIGRQHIAQLCHAIGEEGLDDTDQFLGHVCEIKVSVEPARGQYKARNKVTGYRDSKVVAKAQQTSSVALAQHAAEFEDDDVPF